MKVKAHLWLLPISRTRPLRMDNSQYERFAKIDEEHWWFQSRRAIADSLLRSLVSLRENAQIVDVGTGSGGMLPVLAQFGSVTAAEPDAGTLAFTRNKYSYLPSTRFIHCDWQGLDLPNHNFDLITAFDVLEHCEDDLQALSRWRDLLREDGWLFITVPAFQCLWGDNDVLSYHYRRYTKKSLLAVLQQSSLVVEKISYINAAMFFPVWLSRNVKEPLEKKLGIRREAPWDFELPSPFVNGILQGLFSCEKFILPHISLPLGTSLLAVARVPSAVATGHRDP